MKLRKLLEKIELTLSATNIESMVGHEYLTNLILSVPLFLIEQKELSNLGVPALAFTDYRAIYVIVDSVYDLTPSELLFVLEHEMLHILSDHEFRRGNRDPFLWNLATDAWINATLLKTLPKASSREDFPGHYPPEGIFLLEEVDASTMSEEEIYDYLVKKAKVNVSTIRIRIPMNQSGNEQEQGQGQENRQDHGTGQQENQQQGQKKSQGTDQKNEQQGQGQDELEVEITVMEVEVGGKKFTVPADLSVQGEEEVPESTKRDFTDKVKNMGRVLRENMKQRGLGSGDFSELIDKLLEVKVPWDEILRHAIRNVAVRQENRTWSRPNIYMRSVVKKAGLSLLPGEGEELVPNSLVVAMDTSGSISTEELRKFLSVIADSTNYFKKVVRIEHDYSITDVQVYEQEDSDLILDKDFFTVKGRGGTSHKEVFDKIAEMLEEEEISMVIFLTDYYSDVEEIKDRYSWINEIPVVWVLTKRLEPSFGKVIYID